MRKAELEELLENLPEEPFKIQVSRKWKSMDILKQKVDVLKKATQKVIPKKVSETIE